MFYLQTNHVEAEIVYQDKSNQCVLESVRNSVLDNEVEKNREKQS